MQATAHLLTRGFLLAFIVLLTGCASQFPTPANSVYKNTPAILDGKALFAHTFKAHGGDNIAGLNDVNVSITGQWKTLITKIQPLVSDYTYRVNSEERLLLKPQAYAAFYTGPGGTKKVLKTHRELEVFYNGEPSIDAEVLSSTALTADAFTLFLLGPLVLSQWQDQFIRLSDIEADGKGYYRIYVNKQPGFGFSEGDGLVLWINQKSYLTEKLQITLMGHGSTQRAHVQVDYLDFIEVDGFTFPSDFFEKVNAPIAIDAHAWHLTGIDINRGLTLDVLRGKTYSDKALEPAARINTK